MTHIHMNCIEPSEALTPPPSNRSLLSASGGMGFMDKLEREMRAYPWKFVRQDEDNLDCRELGISIHFQVFEGYLGWHRIFKYINESNVFLDLPLTDKTIDGIKRDLNEIIRRLNDKYIR